MQSWRGINHKENVEKMLARANLQVKMPAYKDFPLDDMTNRSRSSSSESTRYASRSASSRDVSPEISAEALEELERKVRDQQKAISHIRVENANLEKTEKEKTLENISLRHRLREM